MNHKSVPIDVKITSMGITDAIQITKRSTWLLILSLSLCFTGCGKNEAVHQDETSAVSKIKTKVSGAQPLPRGKRNFSVTMGNFDNTGRTWVRIINWTFNETNGTVGATSWTWFSDVEAGKAILGTHYCTMDGIGKTCNQYTPSGWAAGPTIHQSWSGTYVYNTSTGRLDISWSTIAGSSTNATDSWTVTLPETGLARVNLISSNYTLTHGRGYGSNAAWTVFKTVSNVVNQGLLKSYSAGKNIRANESSSGLTIDPAQTSPGLWKPAGFTIAGAGTPSSASPAGTVLHRRIDGAMCSPLISDGGSCTTTKGGTVQHICFTNTNRQVAYSIWCACLPKAVDFPCYVGSMHPFALMQVIDDGGNLKGYVGVETQNEPGYTGYQMQCVDYSDIP